MLAVAEGDTALIHAVRHGQVAVVAAMLAETGDYDVNAPMTKGSCATPLYVACLNGHSEIVTKLLAANADVNKPKTDGSGATPLMIACQEGHTDVVTKLLER